MRTSYHTMTVVKGAKETVLGLIEDWLKQNAFHLHSTTESLPIVAVFNGRFPGLTDRQTGTKMNIIVRELDGVCAISIQHKVRRMLFVTGLMFGNILMTVAEQLISHIKENL